MRTSMQLTRTLFLVRCATLFTLTQVHRLRRRDPLLQRPDARTAQHGRGGRRRCARGCGQCIQPVDGHGRDRLHCHLRRWQIGLIRIKSGSRPRGLGAQRRRVAQGRALGYAGVYPWTAEHACRLRMLACSACRHFGDAVELACACTGKEHAPRICVCVCALPGCFSAPQMLWPRPCARASR